MSEFVLKLYITGRTARSERAIASLHSTCQNELRGRYKLEVIDILERPQLAKDEKILATPTLIKEQPLPVRRVIGDLSESGEVVQALNLPPITETELARACQERAEP